MRGRSSGTVPGPGDRLGQGFVATCDVCGLELRLVVLFPSGLPFMGCPECRNSWPLPQVVAAVKREVNRERALLS